MSVISCSAIRSERREPALRVRRIERGVFSGAYVAILAQKFNA
jgi:hypothetical protein